MYRYLLIISLIFAVNTISSQELNCQVTVNGNQVEGTQEKLIFEQMQKSIYEFMNNTKWTKDNYTSNERIDCSILINVTSRLGGDDYKATIQVQSRRPTFKSSYPTPVFNYFDESFVFKYGQYQQLEFNINTYANNLTSVLAFYAYIVIANDYDTFSNLGGTEYYQKAQTIVSNAQSSNSVGWRSFDGTKNRYWMVENALQPVFQPIRECLYQYHRLGLDIMNDKPDDGRKAILNSTDLLLKVYNDRPASFIMELFFNAKADEFVNIFSKGLPAEKNKIIENLSKVNPTNSNKYSKIQGN
jgi:hypothetical protein